MMTQKAREAILEHIGELRGAVEKLLEELSRYEGKPAGKTTSGQAGDVSAAAMPDDETGILHELATYLEETKDNVGDAIARHPAATAGAAFLLGVAVGRLSR